MTETSFDVWMSLPSMDANTPPRPLEPMVFLASERPTPTAIPTLPTEIAAAADTIKARISAELVDSTFRFAAPFPLPVVPVTEDEMRESTTRAVALEEMMFSAKAPAPERLNAKTPAEIASAAAADVALITA